MVNEFWPEMQPTCDLKNAFSSSAPFISFADLMLLF